jgi:hypothetical protein
MRSEYGWYSCSGWVCAVPDIISTLPYQRYGYRSGIRVRFDGLIEVMKAPLSSAWFQTFRVAIRGASKRHVISMPRRAAQVVS